MTNGIFQSKGTGTSNAENERERETASKEKSEKKEKKNITAAVKRGEILQQLTFKVERLYTKYELLDQRFL